MDEQMEQEQEQLNATPTSVVQRVALFALLAAVVSLYIGAVIIELVR